MICNPGTKHRPTHGGWSARTSDVHHPRILVADDEPHLLHLVQVRLERSGLDVVVARDGEEALERARATQPDLCVLDVVMPKRTGLDVLQALRADADTARMKVIMLTAKAYDADIDVGFALGADDYITKPFSPRELVTRVCAHLSTC
jgi:DNA-binding response OmpR family regulator